MTDFTPCSFDSSICLGCYSRCEKPDKVRKIYCWGLGYYRETFGGKPDKRVLVDSEGFCFLGPIVLSYNYIPNYGKTCCLCLGCCVGDCSTVDSCRSIGVHSPCYCGTVEIPQHQAKQEKPPVSKEEMPE